jgi:hypothetical protein
VGAQGTTASTPCLLAWQTNDPRQPTTVPTIGEVHPILYGPQIPEVVPELMGCDYGAPEDLQFGKAIHVVYVVKVQQVFPRRTPKGSFPNLYYIEQ